MTNRQRTCAEILEDSKARREAAWAEQAQRRLAASPKVSGSANDAQLQRAYETGEARTPAASTPKHSVGKHVRRFIGNSRRFHPSSPDKEQSRRRKRKWGGSSCVPDWMREHYTEGQRAALAVVVQQVKRQGYCDLRINAIAQLAGVHRTTVQDALRKARTLKHVAVQERPGVAGQLSLTNIVRIVCGSWKAWLRRVGSGFKSLHPSEMKAEKKERAESAALLQGAYEREKAAPQRITAPLSYAEERVCKFAHPPRVSKFADPTPNDAKRSEPWTITTR